jgi:hypothetical protein
MSSQRVTEDSKAELKHVTGERDILKRPPRTYFAK